MLCHSTSCYGRGLVAETESTEQQTRRQLDLGIDSSVYYRHHILFVLKERKHRNNKNIIVFIKQSTSANKLIRNKMES